MTNSVVNVQIFKNIVLD